MQRGGLVVAAIGLLTLVAALGVFVAEGFWSGVFILTAMLALTFTVLAPRHWLPGIALAAFVLLPLTYAPAVNPLIGRYAAPAVAVLIIWFIRSAKLRPSRSRSLVPRAWLSLSGLLVLLSAVSIFRSIDPIRSIAWSITASVVFVGFAWMARKPTGRDARALSRSWLWIGVLAGGFAVIEGLTETSFLATWYSSPNDPNSIGFDQGWSAFRATTTLGHPLMNATFFATTASFALMNATRTRSKLAVLSGVLCAAGSVFTVSRSAVAAIAVGLAVGVLALLATRGISFGRKLFWTLAAAGAAVAVVSSPLIQERSNSAEGAGSADVRSELLDRAFDLAAEDGFVGSGAGTSPVRSYLAGMSLPIENAYAGVMVSLGLAGAAILILLVAGLVLAAVRRGLPDVAAGTVALAVQIGAYPAIDNVPVSLIMLGALSFLCFGRSTLHEHTPSKARKGLYPLGHNRSYGGITVN